MMDAIVDQFDAAEPEASGDPNTLDIDIDVTFQKKRFTMLHLQEPKAKQLERAELELNVTNATPYNFRRYQIALIAAVAKVPTEVIGELPNSQLVRAWRFLRDRLDGDTPEIGET
jgi:hypothetical protein